jgi:hypothetical protein
MKNHLTGSGRHTIFVMLLIYLLFLGQEVVLTQVWCHKYNGTCDLEYALFDYHCHCNHSPTDKKDMGRKELSGSVVESFPGETCCFNVPAENSRLVRNIGAANNVVRIIVFFRIGDSGSAGFRVLLNPLYRNIPLSKFIYKPDCPVSICSLRC